MDSLNLLLLRLESFRAKVQINPYVFAFLSLAVGVLLQFILNNATHQINFRALVIFIFLAAWYGGFFPCIVVTIVGFLIADYFFIPPIHTFFPDPREYLTAGIFVTEGILFGLVGESRKRWESEINKAYDAEQKARKEAEDASQIRDDFVSMASHELKSPITSQKLYLQALAKQVQKNHDTEYEQYIHIITTQTDRMVRLINDLLNVAKIRAGKLVLEYSTFHLEDWVREVVSEVQAIDTTHTIIVRGKSSKLVYADKDRIAQVITNLLSNAMKYSPRAKKVLVKLSEDKKRVAVSVKDYGIGISKTNQRKLFNKYFRAEGANEHTYKGLGMGLFIVAEIIKQHKGKIWVESTEGKGSTFSFSLPVIQEQRMS